MTADVLTAGRSWVVVRHDDAVSGERIGRVRVIVQDGASSPDTLYAPADSVVIVGPAPGDWIVQSAQLGYHAREDTITVRENRTVQVLIPLYPMATDECGMPARVWKP